jgi:hypothetical protein
VGFAPFKAASAIFGAGTAAFPLGRRTAEIAATLDTAVIVPHAVKSFHRNRSAVTGATQRLVSSHSRGGVRASDNDKRLSDFI